MGFLQKHGVGTYFCIKQLSFRYRASALSYNSNIQQKNNATFDKTSLEYQIQIKELEDMIKIFMSQGFTKDEIQSTLLDMANYRHLRDDIIRLVGEAQ